MGGTSIPSLSVRSVVNSGSTVLQSTDYYPFGLAFSDANITNNRYLYNGKVLEDYTIGTSYLGALDYVARHYDPRIARWTVPDPRAEKYYSLSAYIYCGNNPIKIIDIDGQDIYILLYTTGNGQQRRQLTSGLDIHPQAFHVKSIEDNFDTCDGIPDWYPFMRIS